MKLCRALKKRAHGGWWSDVLRAAYGSKGRLTLNARTKQDVALKRKVYYALGEYEDTPYSSKSDAMQQFLPQTSLCSSAMLCLQIA